LKEAESCGTIFPETTTSTWYGEVSATWQNKKKTLRLIVFPQRLPLLYVHEDTGIPLSKGKSISPVSGGDILDKIAWLNL